MKKLLLSLGVKLQVAKMQLDKKNITAGFMLAFVAFAALVVPEVAMAEDPVEVMKGIYVAQAEDNVIPVMIMWILGLTAVTSAVMGRWMPFIFGIAGAIILGISPELIQSFTFTELKAS